MMTIDSLDLVLDAPIALKLDVEGQEMRALQGATRTNRQAPEFVIQIEAAKGLLRRTGEEAMKVLRFLNQLQLCRSTVFEKITGSTHRGTDLDRPLFPQPPEQYKVVDVSARSVS